MGMKAHLLPVTQYKEPVEFEDQQLKIFWLPGEIKVEKDIQDILVNFTEAEKHAVISVLKLFSIYETHAGDEYWGRRFKDMFDGAEFHRMASVFSMFELSIHAPFYNKINELLHINTPEFYNSYQEDEVLNARVKHLGDIIDHNNDLVSLAAFSMVEGVILYSSFAFLKHYQSEGKNKLMNVVRGINFSVRDENLHSLAGAWAFKVKLENYKERWKKLGYNVEEQQNLVLEKISEAEDLLVEHEYQIIDKIFEKGEIPGITAHQLKQFVFSRVNECRKQLGLPNKYNVKYNPIANWFYKGINNYQFNDFFSGQGREYNRQWDETGFVWKGNNE